MREKPPGAKKGTMACFPEKAQVVSYRYVFSGDGGRGRWLVSTKGNNGAECGKERRKVGKYNATSNEYNFKTGGGGWEGGVSSLSERDTSRMTEEWQTIWDCVNLHRRRTNSKCSEAGKLRRVERRVTEGNLGVRGEKNLDV